MQRLDDDDNIAPVGDVTANPTAKRGPELSKRASIAGPVGDGRYTNSNNSGFLDSSDGSIEIDLTIRRQIKIRQKVILSIGIVVGVFGASLLALLCMLYVQPYLSTSHLVASECRVSNDTVLGQQLISCHCDDAGTQCTSKYACLQIKVDHLPKNKRDSTPLRALLYDNLDTYKLYSKSNTYSTDKRIEHCSFHICHSRMQENIHRIESYHLSNGRVGHTTTCYCSELLAGSGSGPPPDHAYCLANVVSRLRLIHALLWPSVCVVAGVLVLAVYVMDVTLCCGRLTSTWCRRLPTSRPFNSLDRPWVKRTPPLLYEPVTL